MTTSERTKPKDIDPRHLHIEGFRRTLNKLKHQYYIASHALESTIENPGAHPSRQEFASFAARFSNETDDKDEMMYASFLGTLPGYIEARQTLLQSTDFQTRKAAILDTIRFNNTLRTAIEVHPHVDEDQLTIIAKSTGHFYQYSSDAISQLGKDMQRRLKGMKHELAFESVLWNLPEGFEVLETTDEDDTDGADYRVRCPNGVSVSIDVKASQYYEEKTYNKQRADLSRQGREMPRNKIILYSGFTNSDFRTDYPWRPTYEATTRLVPLVEQRLRIASGETIAPVDVRVAN